MLKIIPVLLLCAACCAPAQTSAASVRAQSNVVLVPALVRDAKGEVVFNLSASDFRVTDDGVEQKITLDEDTGNEPLSLVVVVQCGGVGSQKFTSYHHLGAVIDAVVGAVPHRVAVVAFDSTPRLKEDFSSNTDDAGDALDNLDRGDHGAAILDALRFSVDLLRKQPPTYRRAILLISETYDHGSQAKLNDALRVLSDTNTTIYALGFSSGKADASRYANKNLPTQPDGFGLSNPNPNPPGGCMGKDADPDAAINKAVRAFDCLTQLLPPLGLVKIAALRAAYGLQQNVPETVAELTGGEYFKFENSRTLVSDMMTISNHVPNPYVLSFQPHSPHPGFHAVTLKLKDHPTLRLTARSGYWADTGTANPAAPASTPPQH